MKKCLFLVFLTLSSFTFAFAEQTVSGVIVDENKEPLIGVSVVAKGTTTGVVTDFDGNYRISVPDGSVLVFSYIGMKTQEIKLRPSDRILNIAMVSDALVIDEVVITAMGVKTEKKKLNFAVQSVAGDALMDSRSANFVTALQGKVAGVNITNSGGSPNGGSHVILRGLSSINPSQSNQPLYILDGAAFSGSTADINPADIENITVLKGAAASALYGQDAANGVIMITTKQGAVGKLTASASIGLQLNMPTRFPETQTTYGPGAMGVYKPENIGGSPAWGAVLDPSVERNNNIEDFFQNGHFEKYDFNINGGSEKFQTYASAGYANHVGIVPNDYLKKTTLLLKGTYKLGKMLTANMTINVVNNKNRGTGSALLNTVGLSASILNSSALNSSAESLRTVYTWPIYSDITEYATSEGWPIFRYIPDGQDVKMGAPVSPLFARHRDSSVTNSTRNILQASLVFTPIRNLNITGRVSYDHNTSFTDAYTVPRFDKQNLVSNFTSKFEAGTPEYNEANAEYYRDYGKDSRLNQQDLAKIIAGSQAILGSYSNASSWSKLLTSTVFATYKLELPIDFSMEFLAGGEIKMNQSFSNSMSGWNFDVPGIYSLLNTYYKPAPSSNRTQIRRMAAFGEVRLDYKGLANLSGTFRADYSSTFRWARNPYNYPSITGGLVFSELFELSNNWFSYGKLRGNWAKVGKDTRPYLFDRRFSQYPTLPDGGYGADPALSTASEILAPEMLSSWEIGVDLRFFDSRTRLDAAYYSTLVTNQIVTVRVSPASGYILQTRNEGDIENRGVEITLEQDIIKNRNFNWTGTLNFGLNRGTVRHLPEGMSEIEGTQYTGIFPVAYLHSSTASVTGKDYQRTPDGQVIVDVSGYPKIISQKSTLIGNREPDFMMGLSSVISYKDLSLSFLFDGRKGGDVVNVTRLGMTSGGAHKMVEKYRGRQIIWEGVVEQPDGTYKPNTTPIAVNYRLINDYYANVGSNFIEDGSYIRLSYVTLTYDLSRFLKKIDWISGLKCSVTGSNLFLLTKYTGSDPQINADTSAGGMGSAGIDNYPVPTTRGFNFTLNATF